MRMAEAIRYRGYRRNTDGSTSERPVPALTFGYTMAAVGTAFEITSATDNIPSGVDGAAEYVKRSLVAVADTRVLAMVVETAFAPAMSEPWLTLVVPLWLLMPDMVCAPEPTLRKFIVSPVLAVRMPAAAGWAEHRLPIAGLYQTGSTTHPGASVSAGPGRNAAAVMLKDFGTSIEEVVQRHAG